MHLIYLDESGNTGNDLNDSQQPVFVLCAMIVEESRWQTLDAELAAVISKRLPGAEFEEMEVHGSDLRRGDGPFKGVAVAERIAFRDEWLSVASRHGVKIVYRAIQKSKYAAWLNQTFGPGVTIHPHVAAFALVAKVVNDHLTSLPGPPLGMFISDENREITPDVEKSIRILRAAGAGPLHLSRIVEKGFFIDSRKSRPLQLCDACALAIRKHAEVTAGLSPVKSIDAGAYPLIEQLIYRGDERFTDVVAWLTQAQKKKRPGT